MGLFTKKYDYFKDGLSFEFDSVTNKYYVCKKNYNLDIGDFDVVIIDENNLNSSTKLELNKKNEELKKNRSLLEYEVFNNKRILRQKKLMAAGIQLNPLIVKPELNKAKYYTKDVKNKFDKLLSEENTVLAIYRVEFENEEDIKDILYNGLIMGSCLKTEDGSPNYDNIEDKASIFSLNEIAISQLFTADAYKNSKGSILIRIPINEYNDEIYYDYNDEKRLKQKYIVGYIPVKSQSQFINKIITKANVEEWVKKTIDETNDERLLYNDDFEDYYYRDLGSYERKKNK